MNKRKLVSIREVSAIYDVENADRVECIQIDGWQCIVKKEEFKVGDLCCFFEIDSFLPIEPRYEFLKKTTKCNGVEGYRIKSQKIRKVLSQGLALPLSMFDLPDNLQVGDEVTSMLGVIKYEPTKSSYDKGSRGGSPKGSFPKFLPKTDQERIQNLTSYFTKYKDHTFEETLKLDGSSMTVFKVVNKLTWLGKLKKLLGFDIPNYRFGVCSRNLELQPSDSNFWNVAKELNLEQLLPCGCALQGELIGPKIQSNHEKVSNYQFYVFDIYDTVEQRYLTPSERKYMMSDSLQSIKHVPIVNDSIAIFNNHDLPSLLTHVEGESMNPKTVSEGRVYKSTTNPELTFKAISNKYLLREK